MTDSAVVHERADVRRSDTTETGKKRFLGKTRMGSDFHHETQRWSNIAREIDVARDIYRERITDEETCEVLRDVDESLRAHRDRGSTRPDRR